MKEYSKIISELASNGYNWTPTFKDIDEKIWIKMGEYFDDDEVVLSALWSEFVDDETKKIGIIFITSNRTFILDMNDDVNSKRIRYTPYDAFSSKKVQTQYSETGNAMNYISLDAQGYGEMRTFATPNKNVAKHFVDTLLNKVSNLEVEELPNSDKPLISDNKKEQLIDKNKKKASEEFDHNLNEKNPDEIKLDESPLWRKAPAENYEKEVEIKAVPQKEFKKQPDKKPKSREISKTYGSKINSKLWYLLFLIPVGILALILVTVLL